MTRTAHRIRPLRPDQASEVELVATRMRATLVEVVDPVDGETMYTMEWLRKRVLWHVNRDACDGEVFLAERDDGHISGHTIVRVQLNDDGEPFGLFSTFFVQLEARHQGLGSALLARGESWMRERGLSEAATFTAETNTPLITLCELKGYTQVPGPPEMVRLSRPLEAGPDAV